MKKIKRLGKEREESLSKEIGDMYKNQMETLERKDIIFEMKTQSCQHNTWGRIKDPLSWKKEK
jgi:hypothetical protein